MHKLSHYLNKIWPFFAAILIGIPLSVLAMDLPNLGFIWKVADIPGDPSGLQTNFTGGFSVNGKPFQNIGWVKPGEIVNIIGEITVDPKHIGQVADIVIYVSYSTLDDPANSILFNLGGEGTIYNWNSKVADLVPFIPQLHLQSIQPVNMWTGPLPEGHLQIHFGYRLADVFAFNQQPIIITISNQPSFEEEAIIRERSVEINTSPLIYEADPFFAEIRKELSLNLFDDVSITAILTDSKTLPNGNIAWTGYADGIPDSQIVLLINSDGSKIIGSVVLPGAAYQIRYDTKNSRQVARQIDLSKILPDLEPAVPTDFSSDRLIRRNDSVAAAENLNPDDGSIIDVMVVYTPAAKEDVADIEQHIQLAVEETNKGYADSGVKHRLNLVHTEEISYNEDDSKSGGNFTPESWDDFLNKIKSADDGYMDNVHDLRDQYKADLVIFLVKHKVAKEIQSCGRAWIMDMNKDPAAYAFSVMSSVCAVAPHYTLAHETGHNMGSVHDPVHANGKKGIFPYSHGYWYQDEKNKEESFGTIMGKVCQEECPPRINRWSNPNLTYQGIPTGIENVSDNVRSLNEAAFTVANFRQSQVTPPPPSFQSCNDLGQPLVAKFTFDDNTYVFDSSLGKENIVTISNGNINGGNWETAALIQSVIVTSNQSSSVENVGNSNRGHFSNTILEPAGQPISTVEFCGTLPPPPPSPEYTVPDQFPTIQSAIDAAQPGDEIRVRPGNYHEDLRLKSDVKVLGSGYENTFIIGTGTTDTVAAFNVENTQLDGFTISNTGREFNAVAIYGGTPEISHNRVMNSKDGIYICCGSSALIRNNVVTENGLADNDGLVDYGIIIISATPRVTNNLVHNNLEEGIYLVWEDSAGTQIINNTIAKNGYDGIWCNEKASASIKNNIIVDNGVGISAIYECTPDISYNNVWGNQWANYDSQSNGMAAPGIGDISADPLFEPTGFHLSWGSPSIDTGDPDPAYNDPDHSRNDMGAYGGTFSQW